MFRAVPRLIARPATLQAVPRTLVAPSRRFLSTAPPAQKSRSWKSLAARLGAAGAIIYYYNTTDVFAEEPQHSIQALPETDAESEQLPTIEAISSERQKRKAVQAQLDAQKAQQEEQERNAAPASGSEGGMGGLEAEADQQGAFNPETGEINWDCPCLGGMADGPCGEQFKAAFSCFVYSTEEPKGMDCIDKFKDMQNCFREYPEVYGSELDSDADDDDEAVAADLGAPADGTPTSPAPASAASPAAEVEAEVAAPKVEEASSTKHKLSGDKTDGKLALVPATYKPDAQKEQ